VKYKKLPFYGEFRIFHFQKRNKIEPFYISPKSKVLKKLPHNYFLDVR